MLSRHEAITARSESSTIPAARSRMRMPIFATLVLLVGALMGTGLTAAGVAEFAIGVRYTQQELDDAEATAEKRGFDRGDKAGYDRGYDVGSSDGYSIGYSTGQNDGCNNVFDEVGDYLIAIRYPFNKLSVYGYYWARSSIC